MKVFNDLQTLMWTMESELEFHPFVNRIRQQGLSSAASRVELAKAQAVVVRWLAWWCGGLVCSSADWEADAAAAAVVGGWVGGGFLGGWRRLGLQGRLLVRRRPRVRTVACLAS